MVDAGSSFMSCAASGAGDQAGGLVTMTAGKMEPASTTSEPLLHLRRPAVKLRLKLCTPFFSSWAPDPALSP